MKRKFFALTSLLSLTLTSCVGGETSSTTSSSTSTSGTSVDSSTTSTTSTTSTDHEHEYSEWKVIEEASCTTEGKRERECTKCGHVESEVINALGHDNKLIEGKEASCTESGIKDYYHCERCDKYFLDEEGKTEITGPDDPSLVIESGAHSLINNTPNYYVHEGECEYCHEAIKGEHNFDENNKCVDCGYVLSYTTDKSIAGIDLTVYSSGNAYATIDFSVFKGEELIIPARCWMGSYPGIVTKVIFENTSQSVTKKIVIPSKVTDLPSFKGMTSLEYVSIGSGVTRIMSGVFSGCTNLKEVDLTNATGLKYIFDKAFKDSGLTRIVIPENVVDIKKEAFSGCTNLAEVTFLGNKIKDFPQKLFYNCKALKEIVIPEGVTTIYSSIKESTPFYGCDNLEKVVLPSTFDCSVEADNIFTSAKNLKHLYVNSETVNLEFVHDYFLPSISAYKEADNYFLETPLTIEIGKNVKNMTNYFLSERYKLAYDPECELDVVEGVAQYWNKNSCFQNADITSYEIYLPTKANLVKAEAVKIGFPPKYQDPIIPDINIYIPEGVINMESKAIFIDLVDDTKLEQTININIYVEADSKPSTWASDFVTLQKGTDSDYTFDKTVVRYHYGASI